MNLFFYFIVLASAEAGLGKLKHFKQFVKNDIRSIKEHLFRKPRRFVPVKTEYTNNSSESIIIYHGSHNQTDTRVKASHIRPKVLAGGHPMYVREPYTIPGFCGWLFAQFGFVPPNAYRIGALYSNGRSAYLCRSKVDNTNMAMGYLEEGNIFCMQFYKNAYVEQRIYQVLTGNCYTFIFVRQQHHEWHSDAMPVGWEYGYGTMGGPTFACRNHDWRQGADRFVYGKVNNNNKLCSIPPSLVDITGNITLSSYWLLIAEALVDPEPLFARNKPPPISFNDGVVTTTPVPTEPGFWANLMPWRGSAPKK